MIRQTFVAALLALAAGASHAATFGYSLSGNALGDYCDDSVPCTLDPITGTDVSQGSPYSFGSNAVDLSAAPRIAATGEASFAAGGVSSRSFTSRGGGDILLRYYMEVSGPGGLSSVPLRTVAQAELEVRGGPTNFASADATAALSITGPGGALVNESLALQYGQFSSGGSIAGGFAVDRTLDYAVGALYQVTMRVSAVAITGFGPFSFTSGPFSATASLDPYFVLPESYAALGYRLEFSGGIVNAPPGDPVDPGDPSPVPLPAGAPLLGATLLGLVVARRRARG